VFLVVADMKRTTRSAVMSALDKLAARDVWVVCPRALSRLAGVDSNVLAAFLSRSAADLGMRVVARGVYLNPRVKPPATALPQVAALIRPHSPSYLSLESVLHEVDWISQIPNRLTFVTTGRSALYSTPLGMIEFVRAKAQGFEERLALTHLDSDRAIRVASPELALADLQAFRRSLDLVRPEEDRNYDHLSFMREQSNGMHTARAC
jgi:hypothetical protein